MENLQYLATQIWKVKSGLSPEIMKEVFVCQKNENYDLRSGTHLANRYMHTAHFWTDTITNLGPKLWNLVPDEIKNATPLSVFKSRIKTLITAHVDYVKLLLKILVLLKSVQIYNEIHNSYLS